MVPCLYWHSVSVRHYFQHNGVSRACRCHWERWMVLRPASVTFHIVLSMNDTGILVAGRSRSEERTSGERAKLESFLPNKLLATRLVAAAKTRETMRGRTSELGGVASMWTLKY